ncbi:hypothetical protein TNCV_828591 [Trichonephila clavipes]|nr:hypothetical protein TNCV_828591 [Trichonephila clavipes]
MFDSSSFVNPTPLAHANASRDVLPRGENTCNSRKYPITTSSSKERFYEGMVIVLRRVNLDCHPSRHVHDEPPIEKIVGTNDMSSA